MRRQESLGLSEAKTSWSRLPAVALGSLILVPVHDSGPSVTGGIRPGSGLADDTVLSGSAAVSSAVVESLVDSKLPSPDLVVCSGSKARAAVGAVNPSKIKFPRIPAT